MYLKSPRITPVPDAELTAEQLPILESVNEEARTLTLFRTVLRAPAAMKALLTWGSYIQGRSNSLAGRDKELVILRTGYLCRAGYEWAQHRRIAARIGMSDAEIDRIKAGADADSWSASDRALLRACDDLHAKQFISDACWAELCEHFSEQQRMDLVFTVGQYTQMCMVLNTFGIQLDPGLELDPDF